MEHALISLSCHKRLNALFVTQSIESFFDERQKKRRRNSFQTHIAELNLNLCFSIIITFLIINKLFDGNIFCVCLNCRWIQSGNEFTSYNFIKYYFIIKVNKMQWESAIFFFVISRKKKCSSALWMSGTMRICLCDGSASNFFLSANKSKINCTKEK